MGLAPPACMDGSNPTTARESPCPIPKRDERWTGPPVVPAVVPAAGPPQEAPTGLARSPVSTKPLQVCLWMLVSLRFPLFGCCCLCRRHVRFLHCQLVQILGRDKVRGDLE